MMSYTKSTAFKYLIICLFLLALPDTNIFAQKKIDEKTDVYEDIFFYAQKLHSAGALEQAELEYKRYIFLQDYSKGIYQTQAFTALAQLYEKNGQWEQAALSMQKAILSVPEDSAELDKMRLEHVRLIEAANKQTNNPLSENLFVFSYMNMPDFSDSIRQYACLSTMNNDINGERFGYAERTFNFLNQTFPDFFNDEEREGIRINLEKINSYKPKKQLLAGYLSFFPGLGQLYAGNYKDSLNAFLLNGAIIAASAYSIWTLDVWTFSLLEFNPLLHFMRGNIYNAQKDVYEYNTRCIQGYKEEILKILENKKALIYMSKS